jgi:hypothetical protein
VRDNWRHHWVDRDWHDDWDDFPFCAGWWAGHSRHYSGPWGFYARRYNDPWYWWGCPTAPRLTAWVAFGWPRTYYWDYGPGHYIYCYNNVIYVNGQWYAPAPAYYERTLVLAQSAPELTQEQAQQIEWLPLGVFAVAKEGVEQPELTLQLAVTKDGILGGTVFNQATGDSFPLEGTVDKKTQRAVWTFVDKNNQRIQMETSIYNLTKPQTTALVHYSPEKIEVRQLIRLDQPEGKGHDAADAPPPAAAEGLLPLPAPAPAQ